MRDICNKLEVYFNDVLGIRIALSPWKTGRRIPLFLEDRYRFFEAEILGQRCLFMIDIYASSESPATIRKHFEQTRGRWDGQVVYVRERIVAYNRKRLIEYKVPFVIPRTQMYLPMFGVDLREHFKKNRQAKKMFSPATQVVLIYALLRDAENINPTRLAKELGYSVMAMSRALDDLELAGLGQTVIDGRQRRLRLKGSKCEVWGKAQPLLRSPVVKRYAINRVSNAIQTYPKAGMDALAHYSMLAEPRNIVVALGRENWRAMRKAEHVEAKVADDHETPIIEVWSYTPILFTDQGWVDRLSLYLSLREIQDERVQAALDQMITEVVW